MGQENKQQLLEEQDLLEKTKKITAFFEAIDKDDIKTIQLTSTHIDLHAKNEDGYTPMHFAAFFGKIDAIRHIMPLIESIDERCEWNRTSLMYAAINGHLEIVALLIQNGADINAKGDSVNITALHLAAEANNIEIVKYLLDQGANPNVADRYERTPYDYAVTHKNLLVQSAINDYKAQRVDHKTLESTEPQTMVESAGTTIVPLENE